MSARRATEKEKRKYGKAWIIRRSKPIISSTPPPAPWSVEAIAASDAAQINRDLPPMLVLHFKRIERGALKGFFDLRVPAWHLSILGCRWFISRRGNDFVRLPNREWTDGSGRKKYDEVLIIDDFYRDRFLDSALHALHRYLEVESTRETEDEAAAENDDETRKNVVHLVGGPDDIPWDDDR